MPSLYEYPVGSGLTGDKLAAEVVAAGLPAPSVVNRYDNTVRVVFAVALTPQQLLALDAVAAAHTPNQPRQLKSQQAIADAVEAWVGTNQARARLLLAHTVAYLVRQKPFLLKKLKELTGLDGDEPQA